MKTEEVKELREIRRINNLKWSKKTKKESKKKFAGKSCTPRRKASKQNNNTLSLTNHGFFRKRTTKEKNTLRLLTKTVDNRCRKQNSKKEKSVTPRKPLFNIKNKF